MTKNQQIFIQHAAQMMRLCSEVVVVGTLGSNMTRKQVIAAAKEAVKQSGRKVKSAKILKDAVHFEMQEA